MCHQFSETINPIMALIYALRHEELHTKAMEPYSSIPLVSF